MSDEEDSYRYFDGAKFKCECERCGSPLNGEAAMVWCHPCADKLDLIRSIIVQATTEANSNPIKHAAIAWRTIGKLQEILK